MARGERQLRAASATTCLASHFERTQSYSLGTYITNRTSLVGTRLMSPSPPLGTHPLHLHLSQHPMSPQSPRMTTRSVLSEPTTLLSSSSPRSLSTLSPPGKPRLKRKLLLPSHRLLEVRSVKSVTCDPSHLFHAAGAKKLTWSERQAMAKKQQEEDEARAHAALGSQPTPPPAPSFRGGVPPPPRAPAMHPPPVAAQEPEEEYSPVSSGIFVVR